MVSVLVGDKVSRELFHLPACQNMWEVWHWWLQREHLEILLQFTTPSPTKCTILFLRYLYYSIALTFIHVLIPKGSSSGNKIKATQHKNKLATFAYSMQNFQNLLSVFSKFNTKLDAHTLLLLF
jgi:hypothetical protein